MKTSIKVLFAGILSAILAAVIPVLLARVFSDDYRGIQGLFEAIIVGKLLQVLGFVITFCIALLLLKRLRITHPFAVSVVGLAWYYLITILYDALVYQPQISALSLVVVFFVGGVSFVAAQRIFAGLPLNLPKPKILAVTCLLTIPLSLIVMVITPPLSDASYKAYNSEASRQNRASKMIRFQAYKPTYLPPGASITQSALFGYSGDFFTADDLNVRIDASGGGMAMNIFESEPMQDIKSYVDIPTVCNLYNLSEAITFKESGYTPAGIYEQHSGCVKVATTPNGREVYGESVPFDTGDVTRYYYTKIDGTVVAISFKPWGSNYPDNTAELVKVVESLTPFDISELAPHK